MNEIDNELDQATVQVPNDELMSDTSNIETEDNDIKMGSMVDQEINCAGCNTIVSTANAYCFEDKQGNDIYYCEECKKNIDQALEAETKNPNIIGAILFGLLAGVVSGAIWCAIAYFTGYTIGYVAIAVGFLIARGVILGSGNKRGFSLQLISAVIALVTILSATYMTYVISLNDYLKTSEMFAQTNIGFIWFSPFNYDTISYMISPVGLFIWAIGILTAFRTPKAKTI